MINLIVIAILVLIAVAIVFFLVREKKKGKKCIGCPYACECKKKNCDSKTNSK